MRDCLPWAWNSSLLECVNGIRSSHVQRKHLKVKAEMEQINGMLKLLHNTAELREELQRNACQKNKKKGKFQLKKLFCCISKC